MSLSRKTKIVLGILAIAAFVFFAFVVALLRVPAPLERWLQARVLLALREHYRSEVQLENLHVTLIPEFRATADRFVLPNRKDATLPPLLTVRHFTVTADPLELLRRPVHLGTLKLEGLEIHVPPKRNRVQQSSSPEANEQQRHRRRGTRWANFVIDRVNADGTMLYILPKQADKEPTEFDIRRLSLRSAGIGQPMKFQAELTNPKPPGIIQSGGHFGPWNFDEPSETKVDGDYSFHNADLSVFKGISGILSSSGNYRGVLRNIVIDGTTDTPEFKLDRGATPVHLSTQFHAIVDGTNGNTYLQPVNAQFLHSNVVAKGAVAGQPGRKGKTITLDVDVHDSRVQDMLALASDTKKALLTGQLKFMSRMVLPPGDEDVLDKLQLQGRFHVTDAHFNNEQMRNKVTEMSRRGQGRPTDQSIQDVPAEFAGSFQLNNSTMSFRKLQFAIPGAQAEVDGSYGLLSQKLDFTGSVKLEATVSQTMTGKKRWLLKPVDPIFMRHASGTYLPVNIKGTREHPEIKLDLGKLFH